MIQGTCLGNYLDVDYYLLVYMICKNSCSTCSWLMKHTYQHENMMEFILGSRRNKLESKRLSIEFIYFVEFDLVEPNTLSLKNIANVDL